MAMGLNNAFMSLGRIVGPIWAGLVFDVNISLPYLTGAIVMLLGFGVSLAWLQKGVPTQPRPVAASTLD